MGISLVLRGDDHLANTPRQILLLEALGATVPDTATCRCCWLPAARRFRSATARPVSTTCACRDIFPAAICNYLVRLGHACGHDAWLELDEMPPYFDLARTSHSAARFDDAQLRHWQREALVRTSTDAQIEHWLGLRLERACGEARAAGIRRGGARQRTVSGRGRELVDTCGDRRFECAGLAEATEQIIDAGTGVLREPRRRPGRRQAAISRPGRAPLTDGTGAKGAKLFMPLRAALTGETHGPELAPFVRLMGAARSSRGGSWPRSAAGRRPDPYFRFRSRPDTPCCRFRIR